MIKFFKRAIDNNLMLFMLLGTVIFLACTSMLMNMIRGEDNSEYVEQEYIPLTPRHMNGVDTIRANDSLYIIKFQIQKVIPNNIQNESQDKYDYESSEEY